MKKDYLMDLVIKIGLILISLTILSIPVYFWLKKPTAKPLELQNSEIIVESGYLRAMANPVFIKPIIYGSLIGCLEWHESKGNDYAIGKAGEKGCLQFMPKTFEQFCVKKYGFKNDIFDPEIQWACADLMIQDGYLKLWTTAKKCL